MALRSTAGLFLSFISCECRHGQVPSSSFLLCVTYLCVSGEGELGTLGYWRFVENTSGACCSYEVPEACHDDACLLHFGRYNDRGPWRTQWTGSPPPHADPESEVIVLQQPCAGQQVVAIWTSAVDLLLLPSDLSCGFHVLFPFSRVGPRWLTRWSGHTLRFLNLLKCVLLSFHHSEQCSLVSQYNGGFRKIWTSGAAVPGSRKFADRAVPGINQLLGEQDLSVLPLHCASLSVLLQLLLLVVHLLGTR